MALLWLLFLLIVLVATGVFWFVLKVALAVALGVFLALVAVAAFAWWRIRRALRSLGGGPGPSAPTLRRGSSEVTILRPRSDPD
jgi:membrane protein implicated in regulation of membrane protease activity